MSTTNHASRQTNLSSKSAGAGLFAAIVASLCCITPVFSLLAGIGGIAATFSWME
ncbi:MAG: heavy metal transporter, partial [Cyclobacteriaceae bacterium]